MITLFRNLTFVQIYICSPKHAVCSSLTIRHNQHFSLPNVQWFFFELWRTWCHNAYGSSQLSTNNKREPPPRDHRCCWCLCFFCAHVQRPFNSSTSKNHKAQRGFIELCWIPFLMCCLMKCSNERATAFESKYIQNMQLRCTLHHGEADCAPLGFPAWRPPPSQVDSTVQASLTSHSLRAATLPLRQPPPCGASAI